MSSTRTQELEQMFARVPIALTFGMKLSYTKEGEAVVDLPYNPDLDHGLGGIHGGVYATMLDTAGWFTAAATHEPSEWLATSELSMHFLKPTQQTALQAIGKFIKRGKRQDIVEIRLYDEHGTLVGHATGTFISLPNVRISQEHLQK